jgi:membrane-bound lytic murein transglycosylase B
MRLLWKLGAFMLASVLVPASVSAGRGRGWDYLIDRLIADGVHEEEVLRAFADPRMEDFDGLDFSPDRPRESSARYRQFLSASSIQHARNCRASHATELAAAERKMGVSASVVAAILHVETGCGRNTGRYVVLHRLARLAMANAPENFQRNLERFTDSDGTIDPRTVARLRERARYLENTFYPEVRATFTLAEHLGIDPLSLRGSPSGAFGYPQFLPTSYLRHGVDGNGDGTVSLYDASDAVFSAARYLAAHGWRPGITRSEQRQVIWYYNRSDAYVDTVLTLAQRIDGKPGSTQRATKPKRGAPKQQVAAKRSASRR